MTLQEKLDKIDTAFDEEKVPKYTSGNAKTIGEFWETFVEPRLPEEEVVKAWHALLLDYVRDTKNITCGIRYGNGRQILNEGEGSREEKGDYSLRRGWLTKNKSDNFSFFYADNFFLSFFDKMYIDGYVPTLEEFKTVMGNRCFPYAYNYFYTSDKNVEYKYHKFPVGKNPGFSKNGYKLCHIIGSGTNYTVNGQIYENIKELSRDYFNLGHTSDWANMPDGIRVLDISEEAKKVIIAVFLRFVHPMNNFLSPSKGRQKHGKLYVINKKEKKRLFNQDIGEYPGLCNYARQYMSDKYGRLYDEFLDLIMIDKVSLSSKVADKNEEIDLEYNYNWSNKNEAEESEESEEYEDILYNFRDHFIEVVVENQLNEVVYMRVFDKYLNYEYDDAEEIDEELLDELEDGDIYIPFFDLLKKCGID